MIEKLDKILGVLLKGFKFLIVLGLIYLLVINPIFSNIDGIISFFSGVIDFGSSDIVSFLFIAVILVVLIWGPLFILSFFSKRLKKLFNKVNHILIACILFWGGSFYFLSETTESGIDFPVITDSAKQYWYIVVMCFGYGLYETYRIIIPDKEEKEDIDDMS